MANVFLGTHVPIPFQPGRDGYVCLWRTCYGGSAPQPEEDLLTIIAQSKLNGELLPQEFLDGSWLLIIFRQRHLTKLAVGHHSVNERIS